MFICVCVFSGGFGKYDNLNPLDLDYYTMGKTTQRQLLGFICFPLHTKPEKQRTAQRELNSGPGPATDS